MIIWAAASPNPGIGVPLSAIARHDGQARRGGAAAAIGAADLPEVKTY